MHPTGYDSGTEPRKSVTGLQYLVRKEGQESRAGAPSDYAPRVSFWKTRSQKIRVILQSHDLNLKPDSATYTMGTGGIFKSKSQFSNLQAGCYVQISIRHAELSYHKV